MKYSLHAARSPLSHNKPSNLSRNAFSQQSRNLSLFGWGSKSNPDDFTKAHSNSPSTQDPTPSLDTLRSVKATHATSDAPDPNLPLPPDPPSTSAAGDALQHLEDSILKPHGASSAHATSDIDLASIPEGIGYLKDVCGLDFGWGPTAIMEYCLEHLHITAGLSWSASIIAMALIFRVLQVPLTLRAAEAGAKMQELKPIMGPIQEEMKLAAQRKDQAQVVLLQQQLRAVMKESGFSFKAMFLPLLVQIPFSFGAFRLLREAGNLPVPAFETESFLWLSNLSSTDPTYLLPLAVGGITYLNMSQSARQQPDNTLMKTMKNFFPVVSFAFMAFQPTSTGIFFLVNGVFQSAQLAALQAPAFRRWYGLPSLKRSTKSGPTGGGPSYGSMNIAPPKATLVQPPTPMQSTPPPASDRSWIDRGVDKSKSVWEKGYIANKVKESSERANENARSAKRAAWEALRKEELESQRRERNRLKQEEASSSRGSE